VHEEFNERRNELIRDQIHEHALQKKKEKIEEVKNKM
jgi:hypothetical protein